MSSEIMLLTVRSGGKSLILDWPAILRSPDRLKDLGSKTVEKNRGEAVTATRDVSRTSWA